MNKVILVLLLFVGVNSYAQTINGRISDVNLAKPIGYASVYYKVKNSGVYSNNSGTFSLGLVPNDTLIISAIGFKKIEIPSAQLTNQLDIKMEQQVFQLEDVTIVNLMSNKIGNKRTELGNLSRDKSSLISGMKGRTVAFYIEPKSLKLGLITALKFGISSMNEAFVKVRLFKVDEQSGEPGDEIILDNNIVNVKVGQKKIHYKLKDQNVYLQGKGVFAALEWIGDASQSASSNNIDPYFTSSKSATATPTYIRFMEKDWEEYLVSYTAAATTRKEKKEGINTYFHEPNFRISLKY